MTEERLFRRKHPLLTGFLILGAIGLFFWVGITFFVASLSRQSGVDFFHTDAVTIAIVPLKGVLTDAEEVLAQLDRFSRNAAVKALVVRIDSPGGAVGAAQEIYREIARVNKVKPVVASMGSVAASGGYYAAIGAGKILASPGTLTGSMGVILKFPNLEEIFQKIGYKDEVVKSGPMKDIGSPSRALSSDERLLLQSLIDEVHKQFVEDIAARRKLAPERVREFADGRIFSGETAKQLGFIDDYGNFNDAVRLAAELAGHPGKNTTLLYPENDRLSFFKLFAVNGLTDILRRTGMEHPRLSYEWTLLP